MIRMSIVKMVKQFQFLETFAVNVKNVRYKLILLLLCQVTAAKAQTTFAQ